MIDFVTDLPILTNWKDNNYDSILDIINRVIKIIYYKSAKITINAPSFADVIIDIVMRHHNFPNLIVTNRKSILISKFWLLQCYFFNIN